MNFPPPPEDISCGDDTRKMSESFDPPSPDLDFLTPWTPAATTGPGGLPKAFTVPTMSPPAPPPPQMTSQNQEVFFDRSSLPLPDPPAPPPPPPPPPPLSSGFGAPPPPPPPPGMKLNSKNETVSILVEINDITPIYQINTSISKAFKASFITDSLCLAFIQELSSQNDCPLPLKDVTEGPNFFCVRASKIMFCICFSISRWGFQFIFIFSFFFRPKSMA